MGSLASKQVALEDRRVVTLRHGALDDAAACLRYAPLVLSESDNFAMEPEDFKFTLEQETVWIKSKVDDPGSILIVATVEDEIIGLLDFRRGQQRKSSHTGSFGISLRAAYRAQGIGSALLAMMIDWARANSLIELIWLEVFSTNPRAIELYKRFGFTESGRVPRKQKLRDGRYADEVFMYLDVAKS